MNVIVAVDKNMGIGKNNQLLVHISSDLKYFKEVTLNSVVVMGYNTYMSLPIRPLPNRTNIVLTTKDVELDGVITVHSLDMLLEVLDKYEVEGKEIFICGGAKIYELMMPYVDKLYVTHILKEYDADIFFPEIDSAKWKKVDSFTREDSLNQENPHIYAIYEKRK